MNVIRIREQELYTKEVNKVALSCEDERRIVQENNIYTLAWGYK